MALFHRATLTPTKAELIADWAPTRPWGPLGRRPDRRDRVLPVRRSRRPRRHGDPPRHRRRCAAAGPAHVPGRTARRRRGRADHRDAALGARHPLGLRRAARPAVRRHARGRDHDGQGEALGMAVYDGRWYIAPTNVRIQGGGWTLERVPVDGFELASDDAAASVLRNDRFELTVFRRPVPGPRPAIGLTATWERARGPRGPRGSARTVGLGGERGSSAEHAPLEGLEADPREDHREADEHGVDGPQRHVADRRERGAEALAHVHQRVDEHEDL